MLYKQFKLVVDEEISHISGPNVAIMSGLKAVQADLLSYVAL